MTTVKSEDAGQFLIKYGLGVEISRLAVLLIAFLAAIGIAALLVTGSDVPWVILGAAAMALPTHFLLVAALFLVTIPNPALFTIGDLVVRPIDVLPVMLAAKRILTWTLLSQEAQNSEKALLNWKPMVPIIALVTTGMISLVQAWDLFGYQNVMQGALGIARFVNILVLALLIALEFRTENSLKRFFTYMTGIAILHTASVLAIGVMFSIGLESVVHEVYEEVGYDPKNLAGFGGDTTDFFRSGGLEGSPEDAAVSLIIYSPFILGFGLLRSHSRGLRAASLIFWFLAIVFTGTRKALAMVPFALLGATRKRGPMSSLVPLLLAVVLLIVGMYFSPTLRVRIADAFINPGQVSASLAGFDAVQETLESSPIFGLGWGYNANREFIRMGDWRWALFDELLSAGIVTRLGLFVMRMQGQYLEPFIDLGILGLSVYLWFAYSTIRWSFQVEAKAPAKFKLPVRSCKVILLLGFLLGLWGGMYNIQGDTYRRLGQFAIYLGFLLAVERISPSTSYSERRAF